MEAIIAQLVGGAIGGNGQANYCRLHQWATLATQSLAPSAALQAVQRWAALWAAQALWQLGQLKRLRLAWTSAEL
jgi:hypothetical protein